MSQTTAAVSTPHRWGRTRRWTQVLLGALLLAGLLIRVPASQADVPHPTGWTLLFADDFSGPAGSQPSRALWHYDVGTSYPNGPQQWGTHEIETYTDHPDNIHLDGQGHLLIVPKRDAMGNWTSARIESNEDNFQAPPGGVLRIEARIQMPDVSGPEALGYWPAFWALGRSFRAHYNWPQAGEFDIMESVNGLDSVWGILHCGANPGGPCGEPYGIGSRSPCPNTACYGTFHTYTFEWDRRTSPEELRWSVDGQVGNRVVQNQLPAETWKELTEQGGYFLVLNLAMGGGFSYAMAGGVPTPTATTEPGHPLVVDYVGVWTRPN